MEFSILGCRFGLTAKIKDCCKRGIGDVRPELPPMLLRYMKKFGDACPADPRLGFVQIGTTRAVDCTSVKPHLHKNQCWQ